VISPVFDFGAPFAELAAGMACPAVAIVVTVPELLYVSTVGAGSSELSHTNRNAAV